MSKKKLQNKLDNLLVELEQDASFLPTSGDQSLPGWSWEVDAEGRYLTITQEVANILGVIPDDFTGKLLASYRVQVHSSTTIADALHKGRFPAELNVNFECPDGTVVPVRMVIFGIPSEKEGFDGYRGFVQLFQGINAEGWNAHEPLSPSAEPPSAGPDLPERRPESPVSAPKQPTKPPKKEPTRPQTRRIREPKPGVVPLIDRPIPEALASAPGAKAIARSGDQEEAASIMVPVRLQEDTHGLLEIIDESPDRYWSEDERRLVEQVSDQLTQALENAYLFQAEQRRATELNTLVELSRLVSQNLDLEEVFSTAYQITNRLMQSESFLINLLDARTDDFLTAYAVERGERLPVTHFGKELGFSGYVLKTGVAYLARDLENEAPPFERSVIPGSKGATRSVMIVPLQYSEQFIGTISVQSTAPYAFSEYDLKLLGTFADHIAIAINNARLFAQTQAALATSENLYSITSIASRSLDLNQILAEVLEKVMTATSFEVGLISLVDKNTGKLKLFVQRNLPEPFAEKLSTNGFDGTLSKQVYDSGGMVTIANLEGVTPIDVKELIKLGLRAYAGVPLISKKNVLGTLCAFSYNTKENLTHEIDLMSVAGQQIGIAVENSNLFQQTQDTLAVTETLYETSAELNIAQSYLDIINILREHTIIGGTSHLVSIVYFDHPYIPQLLPESVEVIARWTPLATETLSQRYPYSTFASIDRLTQDKPLVIDDVLKNPLMDEPARQLYLERFHARSTIFFPLVVAGQWLGFINAQYPEANTFSEERVRQAQNLITQASVAIQNLRNIDIAEQRAKEAQRRSEELALVNRVVSAVVSSPDLRQVLEIMAAELVNIFDIGHVGISLLNEDRTHLSVVSDRYMDAGPTEVGNKVAIKDVPACQETINSRSLSIIQDVQTNPLVISNLINQHWQDVYSVVLLPIISGGNVTGMVNMDVMEKDRKLSPQEMTLAETLVGQISTAIQNANLFDQIQNALAETETLYRASAELNAIETYEDILTILRKTTIIGHMDSGNASINLFDRPWVGDEMPDTTMPIARWARVPYLDIPASRMLLHNWPNVKQLLRPDQAVTVEDTLTDPRIDRVTQNLVVERLSAKSLLYVPLVVGGRWIGYLSTSYMEQISFPTGEIKRLMALASQAAVSIQNLRLLEESRRRAAQLETAAEIARDTSGTLALDTLLRRAVNLIRDRYGFYHASIFLVDESGMNAIIRESTGEAGEEMKRRAHKLPVGSRSLIGYVTETGKPLVLNDVTQDPIHRPNPLLPDTRSELGLPLKIGNRVIGALDVQSSEINSFSGDDVTVVQTLADQIAVAVDNAHSYELAQQAIDETRQRVQELSALFGVSQSLAGAAMETEEISHIVAQRFIELMNFPQCSVSLVDPESNIQHIVLELARERDPRRVADLKMTARTGTSFTLQDSPATAKVLENLLPLVVQANDPQVNPADLSYMKINNIATMVVIPLSAKGLAIGAIRLEAWDVARNLSPDQLNLSMIMANAAAVALENARLYNEQRATSEKLREVDKMKSQFLANMSHELRTPLNSIIGFSRVILKGIDGPISELQQQDLSAIFNAGQHLLDLINNVLDISKIEAGKMELAFDDNVNLTDLLTSVMTTAAGLVKDKPIKLDKYVEEGLPPVRADVTRIRQVILNLVSNAIKFTETGSITVRLETQVTTEGRSEVIVKVVDTGTGIAEVDQKKLFLPFSQVDDSPTRKTGGTGLGLSICRLLIEMHGGKIGVNSDVGKGSTFWFVLPLPYQEVKPVTGRKLILAVDDERPILKLYDRYLTAHGYQVVPLTDPDKVVQRAKEIRPFAITLDIMMPNRNGWQVLEALKNDVETRTIPVVVCTILEDTEKGFSLGAADYLMKPILEEDLVTALKRLDGDGSIREVLIIDDDQTDLRLVEKILGAESRYHLTFANGGTQGLVAIQSNKPHLVILDLFMPGLDGFTLMETMRADPSLRNIPVIIFTAGDLTEEQQRNLSKFSESMLQKGVFKEEELLESIEAALRRFDTTAGD